MRHANGTGTEVLSAPCLRACASGGSPRSSSSRSSASASWCAGSGNPSRVPAGGRSTSSPTTLDAGSRLGSGQPLYADPKYLYPPLASLLGIPFLALDRFSASLVLAAGKVLLAAVGVLWLTPNWRPTSRALAVVGLVCLAPVPARPHARQRERPAGWGDGGGGLRTAHAAKRGACWASRPRSSRSRSWRRSSCGSSCSAGRCSRARWSQAQSRLRRPQWLVAGPSASYADWAHAVGRRVHAEPFAGNHGVTALAPALWPPVAAATAALLVLVLARRGPRVGLAWALASGILLAPYAGTYSALPIGAGAPGYRSARPGAGPRSRGHLADRDHAPSAVLCRRDHARLARAPGADERPARIWACRRRPPAALAPG